MGTLDPASLDRLLAAIKERLAAHARVIAIERRHFATAAGLIVRSRVPLRSGDALHLAIASDGAAELVTLDRHMAEAGRALGLGARLLA